MTLTSLYFTDFLINMRTRLGKSFSVCRNLQPKVTRPRSVVNEPGMAFALCLWTSGHLWKFLACPPYHPKITVSTWIWCLDVLTRTHGELRAFLWPPLFLWYVSPYCISFKLYHYLVLKGQPAVFVLHLSKIDVESLDIELLMFHIFQVRLSGRFIYNCRRLMDP